MSLICNLPKYICLFFFKEWLELHEICRLESSVMSSSNQRTKILDFISTCDVSSSKNTNQLYNHNYLYWLLLRNAKINRLNYKICGTTGELKMQSKLRSISFSILQSVINLSI